MYLILLTVPSRSSNSNMSHACSSIIMIFRCLFTARSRHSSLNSSPGNLLACAWTWLPNRQEVLSSLKIIFSHILQLQLAYHLLHWIGLRIWTIGRLASHQPLPACTCLVGPQTELQASATWSRGVHPMGGNEAEIFIIAILVGE